MQESESCHRDFFAIRIAVWLIFKNTNGSHDLIIAIQRYSIMKAATAYLGNWEDGSISFYTCLTPLIALVSLLLVFILACSSTRVQDGPKHLPDPVPGLFNTLQFVMNNHKFMTRVQIAMQDVTVLRFNLGPKTTSLVSGSQAIRSIFGRELIHGVTNQEQMTRFALPTLYRMNAAEVRRWEQDKSGVSKVPISGTEHLPDRQRLWFNYEHIYSEYLGVTTRVNYKSDRFVRGVCSTRSLNIVLSNKGFTIITKSLRDYSHSIPRKNRMLRLIAE